MENLTTTDLSEFGMREIIEANKLLTAWVNNGDITAFDFKEGDIKNLLHEALIKIASHDIELLSYKGQKLFNQLSNKGE